MKTDEHRRYDRYLFSMCGLSGLMYGIDVGLIAAALPYIKETCSFSTFQLASVVAAVLLGSVFGKPAAAVASERFGRLCTLRLTSLVFAVSVPVICFSQGAFLPMFIGRILQGIGCGMMGLVTPLYMSECAPPESRGRGAGIIQLVLCLGLVVAALVGLAVTSVCGAAESPEIPMAVKTTAWKVIFWISLVPSVAMLVFSLRLRESPRWLFKKGRKEDAYRSLLASNSSDDVKAIIDGMERNLAASYVPEEGVMQRESLLRRKYVVPFLIAMAVVVLTQLTGVNSILNYSVVLMHKAGLADTGANWSDTVIKTANVLMTAAAMLLVDRVGRKRLLSVGAAGMAVGLSLAGLTFFGIESGWLEPSPFAGWMVTAGFVVFISAFATGPGICVWLVESELLPLRIRAHGMMIIGFAQMTGSWLLAQTFLPWSAAFGESSVMFTLSALAAVFFVISAFLLPETKGRSLEDLERMFEKEKTK